MAENENSNQEAQAAAESESRNASTFDIRKIYLADASLESPHAPGIFLAGNTQPEISIDVSIKSDRLEQEEYYDVSLGITVTATVEEQTAFLCEVHQAGVFHIVGLADEDLPLALQIACPNVLLPFAREAISDLVGKAGFPQLLLTPINFEALYQQKNAQAQKPAAADEQTH